MQFLFQTGSIKSDDEAVPDEYKEEGFYSKLVRLKVDNTFLPASVIW